MVRTGVRVALRHHLPGAQIEEAGCAKEALAALENWTPQIVLLDVNLPGTNGLDLVRMIRARDRKIKVLMVAADADPWTVSEALQAGAAGFVSKTNSGEALPEALQVVLAGGRFLCPDSRAALHRAEKYDQGAAEPPGPAVLSSREREILSYFARGENSKTIAALLAISPKTVDSHRQHIHRKLGTSNPVALVRYAIRHGLSRV